MADDEILNDLADAVLRLRVVFEKHGYEMPVIEVSGRFVDSINHAMAKSPFYVTHDEDEFRAKAKPMMCAGLEFRRRS